jgi:hypothetical protein
VSWIVPNMTSSLVAGDFFAPISCSMHDTSVDHIICTTNFVFNDSSNSTMQYPFSWTVHDNLNAMKYELLSNVKYWISVDSTGIFCYQIGAPCWIYKVGAWAVVDMQNLLLPLFIGALLLESDQSCKNVEKFVDEICSWTSCCHQHILSSVGRSYWDIIFLLGNNPNSGVCLTNSYSCWEALSSFVVIFNPQLRLTLPCSAFYVCMSLQ